MQYILAGNECTVYENDIVDIATIFTTEIVVKLAYFDGVSLRILGRTLPNADFILMEDWPYFDSNSIYHTVEQMDMSSVHATVF